MNYFRFKDRKAGTNRTLNSEQNHIIRFLTIYNRLDEIFLPTEETMIGYVVYASFGLAAKSIPHYLGAWKKLHSDNPDACRGTTFEQHTKPFVTMRRIYDGITQSFGVTRTNVQEAFPSSLIILMVATALRESSIDADQFIAYFLLAIFAVRRLADLMARIDSEYSSVRHVSLADLWIGPDHMIIRIKATKTRGLLEEPLMFPIARLPGNILCPVAAMERHLARILRSNRSMHQTDPLFQKVAKGYFTGKTLGKDVASADIRARAAHEMGRAAPEYSGRSCRVTGATLLMKMGVADWLVRWLGDWKESLHWGVYVRTPLPELLIMTRKAGDALRI